MEIRYPPFPLPLVSLFSLSPYASLNELFRPISFTLSESFLIASFFRSISLRLSPAQFLFFIPLFSCSISYLRAKARSLTCILFSCKIGTPLQFFFIFFLRMQCNVVAQTPFRLQRCIQIRSCCCK